MKFASIHCEFNGLIIAHTGMSDKTKPTRREVDPVADKKSHGGSIPPWLLYAIVG